MTQAPIPDFLAPFVLEIGMEEMPAGAMPGVAAYFEEQARHFFERERLEASHLRFGATCRRLVMAADAVLKRQEDRVVVQKGPPEKFFKNPDGSFSKQAEGFARKFNKAPEDVRVQDGYLALDVEETGRAATELLGQFVWHFLETCPLSKRMTWGDEFTFLRPVRWVLGLVGKETVKFESKLIKAGHTTHEPRAFGSKPISLMKAGDYEDTMHRLGVVLNPEKRLAQLRHLVDDLLKNDPLDALERDREELLAEINWLVETPTAALASFEKEFLSVPPEVVRVVLMRHQRYLPLVDAGLDAPETYANRFVVVLDRPGGAELAESLKGHERVVRARLSDAHFFWEQDKAEPLDSPGRIEKLKGIVWHPKLGSLYEKQERVRRLAEKLVEENILQDQDGHLKTAAGLYRLDRSTALVGEFPELEGAVGARIEEDRNDHPISEDRFAAWGRNRFGGERLSLGQIIANAMGLKKEPAQVAFEPGVPHGTGAYLLTLDRIDTLVNFFGIGIQPSASEDPFGLRRTAIQALFPMAMDFVTISREKLLKTAFQIAVDDGKVDENYEHSLAAVSEFLDDRLEHVLLELHPGTGISVIRAALQGRPVFTSRSDSGAIVEVRELAGLTGANFRIGELKHQISNNSELKSIAEAAIRAQNISAGINRAEVAVSPPEWTEENEAWQKMHSFFLEWREGVSANPAPQISWEFAKRGAEQVHRFFESVMVNDEDNSRRNDNLSLVGALGLLFGQLADFRELKPLLGQL